MQVEIGEDWDEWWHFHCEFVYGDAHFIARIAHSHESYIPLRWNLQLSPQLKLLPSVNADAQLKKFTSVQD